MSAEANNRIPETSLLRLFRCMNAEEQADLIRSVLQTLGERCSFDPNYARYRPESIQQELENDNLDGRLLSVWPPDWPSQQIVELDNLGDPSEWLANLLPQDVVACLFGFEDLQGLAFGLAQDYLSDVREGGGSLPSDFGDEPNPGGWTADDENRVRAEFEAFFEHWRERVLNTLEKQNAAQKGQGA